MKPYRGFPPLTHDMNIFRPAFLGLLLLGLGACRTSPPQREIATPAAVSQAAAVPADAREYRVIAEESQLQILVYRGGSMARMGHNHVITSHHLDGAVYVADDATHTRFDISFPVNALAIDEPAMREQNGPDFPPSVPQSARDGTRSNMLSPALLGGEQYPHIRLRALDVVAAGDAYDVGVEITIKDQARTVRVPVQVIRADGAVTASGEFALKQTDLGLKPFSVMLGALVVIDEMRIRFSVVARRAP